MDVDAINNIAEYLNKKDEVNFFNFYEEIIQTKKKMSELQKKRVSLAKKSVSILGELEYYRKKIKSLNKLMNRVNSHITHVNPIKFNSETVNDKFTKINLITQYYLESNLNRRSEILESIHANLKNPYVDKLTLFIESNATNICTELISHIDTEFAHKCEFIQTRHRLTYKTALDYARDIADESYVFILLNNDCYFDDSVQLVKKVNFDIDDKILCFTRYDKLPDGTIERGKSPPVYSDEYKWDEEYEMDREKWPTLDYNCSDAWAFTSNIPRFHDNYEIGTFNCEYYFADSAFKNGITLRNPSEYIKCVHIHNTNLRRKYALDNNITSNNINMLYPCEKNPRTSANRIIGSWRLRSKYNYVDKDQEYHEYTKYVVADFKEICE